MDLLIQPDHSYPRMRNCHLYSSASNHLFELHTSHKSQHITWSFDYTVSIFRQKQHVKTQKSLINLTKVNSKLHINKWNEFVEQKLVKMRKRCYLKIVSSSAESFFLLKNSRIKVKAEKGQDVKNQVSKKEAILTWYIDRPAKHDVLKYTTKWLQRNCFFST